MAEQVDDRRPKSIRVMAKGTYPLVAALTQESTYAAGSVVMIHGKALELSLVPARFCSSTASALSVLLSPHRCIGFGRAAVVDGALKAEAALSMPPVVGLLAG